MTRSAKRPVKWPSSNPWQAFIDANGGSWPEGVK